MDNLDNRYKHLSETTIVVSLLESDFVPGEHEAYAFVTDKLSFGGLSRLESTVLRMLEPLDWDSIEKEVKAVRDVTGYVSPEESKSVDTDSSTLIGMLVKLGAPVDFISWIRNQPANSVDSIDSVFATCPRGDWLLWYAKRTDTPFKILAPVVYRAVNRALAHVAKTLDAAGIQHTLHKHKVTDKASAAAVAKEAVLLADVAYKAAQVAESTDAAWADADAASKATWSISWAARAAKDSKAVRAVRESVKAVRESDASFMGHEDVVAAQYLACANDCRELLSLQPL